MSTLRRWFLLWEGRDHWMFFRAGLGFRLVPKAA